MNNHIWVVSEGAFYCDGSSPEFACLTKKDAFKMCRNAGFKWSSDEEIFYNNTRSVYRRVEKLPLYTEVKP